MKKIIFIIISIFLLSGCVNIELLEQKQILNYLTTTAQKANTYRTGFSYYLPKGMQVDDSSLFNEVISSKDGIYYLYVDAISYHKKINANYKEISSAYFSKNIKVGEKFGYLENILLKLCIIMLK